jgi:phosphate-selective porin
VVEGGEEDNAGVTLNWYPHYYLRFSTNYVKVVDQQRAAVRNKPSVFQLRAQVAF